ncbi:uncharacterized protein MONBRDRAFT_13119, partial [Monosiga brevicollis MX1]
FILHRRKQNRVTVPATSEDLYAFFDVRDADIWEVERRFVRLGEKLGNGAFGQVFRAWFCNRHSGEERSCAAKALKPGAPFRARQDFLSEMTVMKEIGAHPNIIGIFGHCLRDEPHILLVELAELGNLRDYLRKCRTSQSKPQLLGSRQLADFCLQIASGMSFLERKNVIHRDLAARNSHQYATPRPDGERRLVIMRVMFGRAYVHSSPLFGALAPPLLSDAPINERGLGIGGLLDVSCFVCVCVVTDRLCLDGRTALNMACSHGHVKVVEMLLKLGVDTEAKDNGGFTPLHRACHYGAVKMVEMLLKHGADAKAKNDRGNTPLRFACQKYAVEVEMLLKHGAVTEAKNSVSTVPNPPSSPLYRLLLLLPLPIVFGPVPRSSTPCPPVRVGSPPDSFSSFPPSLFPVLRPGFVGAPCTPLCFVVS